MAEDRSPRNGKIPAPSHTFAALAHPGFRLYYVGQGISLIGTWLQAAAVRWIVFEQTGSEFLLGVVEAANLMPGLLVGLFAGALADRVSPRTMILAMEAVQMVLALLLALLVGLGVVQFWQMVLILALARISVTFELPSRQVFFFDLVGKETLPNAIALNSGLFNATRVIGPALSGVGLAVLGATGCFTLNGLSYLAAIAAVFFIRLPRKERIAQRPGLGVKELLAGLSYIGRHRRMLSHFLLMTFFGFIGMGYEAMIPAYTRRIVGADVEGYSLMLAFGGLGATAGALTVAKLGRIERKDLLVIAGISVFSASLGGRGLLSVLGRPRLAGRSPGGGGLGLPPGGGLRGVALLLGDPDGGSTDRSSTSSGQGDGGLDDRLLRVGAAGRPLDRPRRACPWG